MAATPIAITSGGFQSSVVLPATAAAAEMSFVNNGYTVIYVNNASEDTATVVTITQVPDNAGREVDPFHTTVAFGTQRLFGPFRPVWFNQAGVVNIAFSETDNVTVAAVNLQF